jgi:hypothetical protein
MFWMPFRAELYEVGAYKVPVIPFLTLRGLYILNELEAADVQQCSKYFFGGFCEGLKKMGHGPN